MKTTTLIIFIILWSVVVLFACLVILNRMEARQSIENGNPCFDCRVGAGWQDKMKLNIF